MLVLSRAVGEEIILVLPDGREIRVCVTAASGRVRLGVTAPTDVRIWRPDAPAHRPPQPQSPSPGKGGGV